MLKLFDSLRDLTPLTVVIRMLISFLCGGLIGLERSYKNRPAGIRTHMLVCIGSTIAAMTGIYLAVNRELPTDMSRLGAQVVSGLGFIGGGTILVTKSKKIKGLTTAAGLWASGIIGLAIGVGFFEGGLLAAAFVLCIEIFFTDIGSKLRTNAEFHLRLTYQEKTVLDQVLRCCKDNRFAISNLQVTGIYDLEAPVYTAIISLRSRKFTTIEALLARITEREGVLGAELTEL